MALGLYVKALSAGELTERLARLAQVTFPNEGVSLTVDLNAGVSLQIGNHTAHEIASMAEVKTFIHTFGDEPHLIVKSASVRSNQHSNYYVNYATTDGLVGTFDVNLPGDPERAARNFDFINNEFAITSAKDVISGRMDASEAAGLQLRERSVSDLKEETAKLAKFLGELARRDAEWRREVQEKLEADYHELRTKLDEEARQKESALEETDRKRRESLAKEREAFAAEVNKFEAVESKRMRRDLLKKIQDVLDNAKDFSLSEKTSEKREIIHTYTKWLIRISAGLVILFAYIFFESVSKAENGAPDWKVYPPLAVSIATLVSSFVYYLKWNDRWFREHADQEFAISRFRTDILRASWVAELVSEWQTETEEAVPPELVAAFTRNLFRDGGPSRENEHPLEAITGAMKRVTSVTIGKDRISLRGVSEMLPDRREKRRLSGSAEKARSKPKTADHEGNGMTEPTTGDV